MALLTLLVAERHYCRFWLTSRETLLSLGGSLFSSLNYTGSAIVNCQFVMPRQHFEG